MSCVEVFKGCLPVSCRVHKILKLMSSQETNDPAGRGSDAPLNKGGFAAHKERLPAVDFDAPPAAPAPSPAAAAAPPGPIPR